MRKLLIFIIIGLILPISCKEKDSKSVVVAEAAKDSIPQSNLENEFTIDPDLADWQPESDFEKSDFIPIEPVWVVFHCTATKSTGRFTVKTLLHFFLNTLGWSRPGYHRWVDRDGTIYKLHDYGCDEFLDYDEMSWGVRGHNNACIHIAWEGGYDGVNDMTPEQVESLKKLYVQVKERYPNIQLRGHRDFSKDLNGDGEITPDEWIKKCPSVDIHKLMRDL
jgi:hypothetical protein